MIEWITWEEWTLIGLLLLASVLLIWAIRTAEPERPAARVPRHARWTLEGSTTRLHHADVTASVPMGRDGGQAQRLPKREYLPWGPTPRERTYWPPVHDHDLDR